MISGYNDYSLIFIMRGVYMIKRFFAAICLIVMICFFVFEYFNQNDAVFTLNSYYINKRTVIVDAGHGGFDGGAVAYDGTIEKDLNLAISQKLESILIILGYNPVMVRDSDVSTENSENDSGSKKASDIKNRVALMKKYPDACFVSIHMNKYQTSQPHGAQVFYSKFNGSDILAKSIQQSIHNNVQQDNNRVVKPTTKSIYLLNHATIPTVIAECGFLSNNNDLLNLKNSDYQLKIAASIAYGIVDYFNLTKE